MNNINKLPHLDNRLSAAADMVHGKVAADVGTDHGYLAAYLVISGKCDLVIASDVNSMPLEKCRATAKLYGVEGKIDVCLADGLKGLPLDVKGVTDIIICGMGGELIAKIIEHSDYTRRTGVRLILGAMSSVEELRDYLAHRGFAVREQRTTQAAGKLYQLIAAEYTGEPYTLTPSERCVGAVDGIRKRNDPLLEELILQQIKKIRVKLEGKRRGECDTSEEEELIRSLMALFDECKLQ